MPPVPGDDGTEDRARALFDAQPHRHPGGQTPDWSVQPDHLKEVFRRFIREGRKPQR